MRKINISKNVADVESAHIEYIISYATNIEISTYIFIYDRIASMYLTIKNKKKIIFEIGCYDLILPDIFPTLLKMENTAREYCEESREILSDLLPKEGEEQ